MYNVKTMKRGCGVPVLPTVFSDALSYGEQISKLTHKINEIINIVNSNLDESVNALLEEKIKNLFIDSVYDAETETLTLSIRYGEEV